jgi:thiol-disulfide isomerase/thioredoxin
MLIVKSAMPIVKNTMRVMLTAMLAVFLMSCGKQAPPVTLELLDGNVLHQKDWQGKWVFINYWAEWCKPCAEEVPELNRFAASKPDVLVLGVNFDKPKVADLLRQTNGFRIEYPVVTNDIQPAFPHAVPQGLPATIVINPEGKIVDTLQGPQTQATLAQAMKL